jgi:hypothetical protein
MTSLGYSDFSENGNVPTNNSKIANRRNNANIPKNRTLKVPRDENNNRERGIINSVSGHDAGNGGAGGVTNENGNNNGVIQQAGHKVKQIKDYIENIHRKGGEDSDQEDEDAGGNYTSVLPEYPGQGMGIYSTNTTKNAIIRGEENGAGSGPIPTTISSNNNVVRKTTQLNSLNPSSAYSSTLLEGTNPASINSLAASVGSMPYTMPYGETGRNSNPAGIAKDNNRTFSNNKDSTTSTYARQYYEQFVPYAENLANQLASPSGMSGTNVALIEKLNYIIHMLEQKKDEKTGHVIEELILYCFIGIFIIFIVDTFAKSGGMGGGRGGIVNMAGGARYRRNI